MVSRTILETIFCSNIKHKRLLEKIYTSYVLFVGPVIVQSILWPEIVWYAMYAIHSYMFIDYILYLCLYKFD